MDRIDNHSMSSNGQYYTIPSIHPILVYWAGEYLVAISLTSLTYQCYIAPQSSCPPRAHAARKVGLQKTSSAHENLHGKRDDPVIGLSRASAGLKKENNAVVSTEDAQTDFNRSNRGGGEPRRPQDSKTSIPITTGYRCIYFQYASVSTCLEA